MTTTCRPSAHEDFLGVECAWPTPARRWPRPGASKAPRSKWAVPRRWASPLAIALLLAFGTWQLGAAGYIHAKAWLAQRLIQGAWARSLHTGQPTRPWPWADTWPVARLTVPGRAVDLYVLSGSSGRTLAFGPGHVGGSAAPGAPGNSVIGGHRDTHFAFLREIQAGEVIELQDSQRRTTRYRVTGVRVVDQEDVAVMAQPAAGRYLTLVTCYPFDALRAGGPLRYVVMAEVVRE